MQKRTGLQFLLIGLVIAVAAVTWDLTFVMSEEKMAGGGGMNVVAHNAAATVVVILGVLLAAWGTRMLLLDRPRREAYALFAASSLMFADAILHFYVVADHLEIAPFAVFFVVAGIVQVALGFGLFRSRPLVYGLSVLVTVGLIAVFFAARIWTLPFASGPEEWELSGVVSKVLEVLTLVALVVLLYWQRTTAKAGASSETPKAA